MESNLTNEELVALYCEESKDATSLLLSQSEKIKTLIEMVKFRYLVDTQIFLLANGGTAGIFSNFYADLLIHPFVSEDKSDSSSLDKKRLRVFNLNDQSVFTALVNDMGFEKAFTFYMSKYAGRGDLLICASGSGTSKNVVSAINWMEDNEGSTCLITRNPLACEEVKPELCIVFDGNSKYPGQTGKNNFNFHFEDLICKLSHIISGALKDFVKKDAKNI